MYSTAPWTEHVDALCTIAIERRSGKLDQFEAHHLNS